jgi:mRNA-degrading endonuclease RelE of RelBE toxin-antitoxin system|tara:strand:+ start:392 stop:574 length:183 start_codon:yes stop_codon:yes gene_type:complete
MIRVSTEFEQELKRLQKNFQDNFGEKPSLPALTRNLKIEMGKPSIRFELKKYKNRFGEKE